MCCHLYWCQIQNPWKPRRVAQVVRDRRRSVHLNLRVRLRVVMGATRVAGPSKIFPLVINVSVNKLFTFLIVQVFLKMGLFILRWQVSIEEMGQVWKTHRFWSKYVTEDDFLGPRHGFEMVNNGMASKQRYG
ncbi:hypothetical protein MLD38_012131 [Melastoma candidum]|uniref:Uncharacterized protein n=1 Tax=Melastoma candidum TaxID=119954 RepID=A0ACB9R6F0_9MYRT|nr:hypothetical protein MLD38_012131 [Melastoma candidum]